MKNSLLCILALGATAVAGTVGAQTVFTDNFDAYTPSTALVGQGGWTQLGTVATNPIQVSATNAAALTTTGQDAFEAFSTAVAHTDGNSLTTTFTLNLSAVQAAGDYFTHLGDGGASNFFERTFAKTSGAGFLLGLSASSTGTGLTPVYGTTVLNLNQTYTLALTWNFVPGALNDTFTVSVDGTNYVNLTWSQTTTAAEPATISSFNLRQGTAANAATVAGLDNASVALAVGTVAPEPSTYAMGLVGILLLLGVQRMRKGAQAA